MTLNDNSITTIQSEIKNLKALQLFHIHNNPISMIPTSIYHLSNLEDLGLDWLVYHDTESGQSKVYKDEYGQIIIKQFLNFLKAFDKVLKVTK